MLDYRSWVRRLEAFIEDRRARSTEADRRQFHLEVAPPLTRAALEELEQRSGVRLPAPLRAFVTQGAASVAFKWVGPLEAEESFCPAEDLPAWHAECVDYAQESWLTEPEWPLDYTFWRHGWPLARDPAGNGPALWRHARNQPHYPVAYLDHEDESFLIAPTFDQFLKQWERLGYLSFGELLNFRNPDTGFLDSTTLEARRLRESLGLSS